MRRKQNTGEDYEGLRGKLRRDYDRHHDSVVLLDLEERAGGATRAGDSRRLCGNEA